MCSARVTTAYFAAASLLAAFAAGVAGADEALLDEGLAARLSAVATRLLAALPAQAREEAAFPFADGEREDVRYAPLFLEGVRHGALDPEASARIDDLLGTALGPAGLEKVRRIRALEPAVAQKDRGRALGLGRLASGMRDPGRYFLALFGVPSAGAPWGFRYEGHHVSLNVTVAPARVPATTPLFLGAEPRIVPEGWPAAGMQVLRDEEERARALYRALEPELRSRATLPYESGRDLMLGQVRRVAELPSTGVTRGELPRDARAQLDALLEVFLANFAPEIAERRRAEIYAAGRDALRFAWTDAADPPGAFYYRISGPRTLIEVDNTTDGDHVHAVWHDRSGDFGDDVLAAHYREAHGVALACRAAAQSSTAR